MTPSPAPAHDTSADLRIADLPEDLRPEGERLKAQYHALATEAGLMNPAGEFAPQKLDDFAFVQHADLNLLTRLAAVGEQLRRLERCDVSRLRSWLQSTLTKDGPPLEAKLEGASLEKQLQRCVMAYAEGGYGFSLDPSSLRFDPSLLPRVQEGLECGALNGIVITAYPTLEQVQVIATRLQRPAEEILDMPVTVFLARHFASRDGRLYEQKERLEGWATLRWIPNNESTTLHAVYTAAKDHAAAYDALQAQQTLRDVLGQTALGFSNVSPEVAVETPLLSATGRSALQQGDGLSYKRLMQERIRMLSPTEFLAFFIAADPKDVAMYPDFQTTWEWVMGITSDIAAHGFSDDDGANLSWNDPSHSNENVRARSVLG